MTNNVIATPQTMTCVPKAEISQKPVTNVPTMLPTVPAAEMRPTVLPVLARSRTASLTTMGETAPRIMLGTKNSAAVKARMRTTIGQASGSWRPSVSAARMPALKTPAARKISAQQPQRRPSVGQASAQVIAQAHPGQHYTDHAGPGVERHADIGRNDPACNELQDHHAGVGDEDDQHRQPGTTREEIEIDHRRLRARAARFGDSGNGR